MRRDCQPCIIKDNQEHQPLKRVEVTEKFIAELELQTAMHHSPELLPVTKIDSSYAPLKSLGMEISNIDNLFISPNGRITLVEAKLWRNPQATREVIAQTLDYAKRLNSWSYEELEKQAKRASKPAPLGNKSLYEFVKDAFPEDVPSEHEFIDAVQKTLREGRFLLLIVGDGIRENIEGMVDMLHNLPQMLFTFGLVEMQIYEGEGINGKLYIPQLVTHTKEILRGVIKVAETGNVKITVDLDEDKKKQNNRTQAKPTLTESEFLNELQTDEAISLFKSLLNFANEVGLTPVWLTSSVSFRITTQNNKAQYLNLFGVNMRGNIYISCLPNQLKNLSLDSKIAIDMYEKLFPLFSNVGFNNKKDGFSRELKPSEVSDNYDEFTEIVKDTVDKIQRELNI